MLTTRWCRIFVNTHYHVVLVCGCEGGGTQHVQSMVSNTLSEHTLGDRIDQLADAVRAQIQTDLEAWRRVPWCVLLAEATNYQQPIDGLTNKPVRHTSTSVSFASGNYARVVNLEMTYFAYARVGLWLVPTGDISGPRVALDCRNGQLLHMTDTVSPRTPLTNPDIVTMLGKATCCVDPAPILAGEAGWLANADRSFMLRYIADRHHTPIYYRPNEPRDLKNQTLVSLAGNWSGTLPELLAACDLLLADEHPIEY